jgi:uncharacterized membrane protein YgdD (TMEM256/DUF423 family)
MTSPVLLLCSGLLGAAGVALAAAAAHAGGGPELTGAAMLLVIHAAALVGLSLHGGRPLGLAGLGLAAGAALFAADLSARAFLGHRLFPSAAPTGGVLMIGGWLVVALVGALRLLRRPV